MSCPASGYRREANRRLSPTGFDHLGGNMRRLASVARAASSLTEVVSECLTTSPP